MTQLEAKQAILDEWRVWPTTHGGDTAHDMLGLYMKLTSDKPHLPRFKCSGNLHWHVVKGWLEDYERFNRPAGAVSHPEWANYQVPPSGA